MKVKKRINESKLNKKSVKIVIVLLIMLMVFLLVYNIVLNYKIDQIIPYTGYAVPTQKLASDLLNEDYNSQDNYIKPVKVEAQDILYKRGNKYYVGDESKTEISLDYPIYVNNELALYNLSSNTTLITNNFNKIEGYPRFTISGKGLYNSDNLEKVDTNIYLFIKNQEGIFINLTEIKIETQYSKYEIPVNSMIAFTENRIAYYVVLEDGFKYNQILDIDFNSKINIENTEEMTYRTLLEKLEIIEAEKETEKEPEKEAGEIIEEIPNEELDNANKEENQIKIEEDNKENLKDENKDENKDNNQKDDEEKNENNEGKDNEQPGEKPEEVYIKPEVKITEFTANVYTANTKILISDPVHKIISPITFVVKSNGKNFLRKTVVTSGNFEIGILYPDTEYTIEANYIYLNEEGNKIQKEYKFAPIKTKKIDTLEPIKIEHEQGEIFSSKIEIKNIKVVSELNSEALKGIKTVSIKIDKNIYKISSSKIEKLLKGEEITQTTSEGLKTNSKFEYEIKMIDIQGNELKVENAKGTAITAKNAPKVDITVRKQDISLTELELNLKNNDETPISEYRYEVCDREGKIVKKGDLELNQKKLSFTDLNPNTYFTINVYANFNLNDGKQNYENIRIGSANFVTVPLTVLGYLHITGNISELTENSINMKMNINNNKTDSRLTNIIKTITFEIYKTDTQELEREITLNEEETTKLKQWEFVDLGINNLSNYTNYSISVYCVVKQGEAEQRLEGMYSIKDFTTLKAPAEVLIKNQFVTESMVDFDVMIDDKNEAILDKKVKAEIRTEKGILVKILNFTPNNGFERVIINKLEEKTNYIISFYAAEYNEGSDATTFKSNYLLKEIKIYTEPGISGTINLIDLKRNSTGKNLIDVRSEVKWYSYCFGSSAYWGKEYNEKTGILSLYAGRSGSSQYYVYDFRDYVGKEVTISFKAKLGEHSSAMRAVQLQNSKTGSSGTRKSITGLSSTEWKEYSYTVNIDNSGYLGFFVQAGSSIDDYYLELKELQVELSNKKTSYKPYEYKINANVSVTLNDLRGEIEENDYYIEIYKNGNLYKTERYQDIVDNKVENVQRTYELDEYSQYEYKLLVKIRDRFYTIASTDFNTKGEIYGIKSVEDFLLIQPLGNYIVETDIDLRGVSTCRFGRYDRWGFNGTLDFQGHKLIRDTSAGEPFERIDKDGVIKNIILEIHLKNASETWEFFGLVERNYGTISNIVVNLEECNKLGNTGFGLIGYYNYDTAVLENFVIHLKTPLYGARHLSAGFLYSAGIIKNGYAYGEKIIADFNLGYGQARDIGVVVRYMERGTIQNVYSLITTDVLPIEGVAQNIGNVVGYNVRGLAQNIYSVGWGNSTVKTYGPTVGQNSDGRNINTYYFTDGVYNNSFNMKTTKLALHNSEFQNNILNGDNQFNVSECVDQGYYPQLIMNDKMPNQEYIALPEVEDADLVDLLSVNVVEESKDKLKVEFSIHNPAGERITNISVENLTVNILSQTYSDEKTILVADLVNPKQYISKYNIRSITSQGAYNIPFTRNYEDGERPIYVDFYKEVSTIDEWKAINKSPSENYRLMTDFDFLNEGGTIRITNKYTGKIEGNNHTIKNIILPETGNGLFSDFAGELKNLTIKNYVQNTKESVYIGVITIARSGCIIDNVHLIDAELSSKRTSVDTYIGGLIGNSTSTIIKNSSVHNVKVNIDGIVTRLATGGFVGYANNVKISNSYAQNINFNINGVLQYLGIGGIVGREENSGGKIQYCYATGKISTDAEMLGGLYGYSNSYNVRNNYSLVDLESTTDYLGGIGGYDNNSDSISTTLNLSLGKLFSRSNTKYVNRIIGSNQTERYNYAYVGQLIDGFVSKEDLGAEKLLTADDLVSEETYSKLLSFGKNFNYEKLSEKILPKLYNVEGTELLPYQEDNVLNTGRMLVEEVEAEKIDMTTLRARIVVNNPGELEIKGVLVEYLEGNVESIITEEGKSYINIVAKPTRAYDDYQISQVIYMIGDQEMIAEQEAKINVTFYNEIYSYEDWQRIDSESAQNYKLMVDIDFENKIEPNTNVSLGRLEGEGEGHTIKNLNITINGKESGLIKEIKNGLENIKFENITITNTASSGNYSGLIVRNIGDIKNVEFNNISVTASNMSYVGMIANNSAVNISNIKLKDVTVKGRNYTGGFLGLSNSGMYNDIEGDNLNINGGQYVGGIAAYITSREPYVIQRIKVSNSNVTGTSSYVGGIFGRAKCAYATVENTNVTGTSYVGGIFGLLDYHSSNNRHNQVSNSKIKGSGQYIGGIAGYSEILYYSTVKDSEIEGTYTSTAYVGGIAGRALRDVGYCISINNNIHSQGYDVGGIAGYYDTGWSLYSSFSTDSTVTGVSNVGGIVGETRYGYIQSNYTNNTVTATTSNAGGIIGFMNNRYMTGANYTTYVYRNYAANSVITAPSNAGGLIGKIYEELYINDNDLNNGKTDSSYFYSNYVDASVNSKGSASIGIGSNPESNSRLRYFYVYENSTINGEKITADYNHLLDKQLLNIEQLKQESTFRNTIGITTYYDTSVVKKGKYPMLSGMSGSTATAGIQIGIDLPTDSLAISELSLNANLMSARLMMRDEGEKREQLPQVEIYPISANEINVEFSNITENAYFKYNNEEIAKIEKRVYTYKYDFKEPIKIEIMNSYDNEIIVKESEDIQNKLSIIDKSYYSLENQNIYVNGEKIDGNYTNLYENTALTTDGKVYNLQTQELGEEQVKGIELQEEYKPLKTTDYKNNTINTYARFSQIKSKEGNSTERNGQIFVANEKMEIVTNTKNKKVNGQIIDYYNGKEYQTILKNNGEIQNLKEAIKCPENFKNKDIEQIVVSQSDAIVLVRYMNGRIYAFNYLLGEELYDNNKKDSISIMDYITNSLNLGTIMEKIEPQENKEYEEVKQFKEKLEETPIEEALANIQIVNIPETEVKQEEIKNTTNNEQVNETNSNNIAGNSDNSKANTVEVTETKRKNYVTTFDGEKYVVYDEDEILNVDTNEAKSENQKVEENEALAEYYDEKTEEEPIKITTVNGFILVTITISAILAILYVLRKRKS